ncbi:DNA-formamidopyrimidine glycosylase family protein [Sinomonas sp. ASV322]|uniref:DNA-formamidopyrimidine glycosylase family protein n=1 Tax=Sinomonas sp. ASV322 TaxID=3041920 RepID=UPI0027DDBDBB|nr:DNA-formamidopyrimidine glycosylase family protein [Sinomonas sp. ASV322]MDQ4503032.1 DNA-formamidopyrimidine glycosylase family protein [Sinomonas sp. ASV322]
MPEGDSVWQTAARVHSGLAGKRLAASDFRVPALATLDLAGWTVLEVVSRGKHLLHRLAAPEPLSIHSHLMMEGSWQVYGPTDRWRKPAHTARVVLRAEDGVSAVGFSLGILEVIPTADEGLVVGHLGPDLLGADWNSDLAEANLRSRPGRAIGLALLDQRNLAGIGNIYRNELCFLARIHPAAPVSAVKDLPGLVAMAHRLLDVNRSRAARNTTGGYGPRGDSWVYGRAGQPCRRCRTRIEHATLGEPAESGPDTWPVEQRERDIYYCPSCQPRS